MAAASRGWPFFDPYYAPSGSTTETSIEIVGGGRHGAGANGSAVLTIECPFRRGVHLQVLEALESMQLDASRAKLAFEGGYVLDELDVPSGVTDEAVLRFAEGSLRGLGGGALSRLGGALEQHQCNVVALEAWTRRGDKAACLVLVKDSSTGEAVRDPWKRGQIRASAVAKSNPRQRQPHQQSRRQQRGSASKLLLGLLDNIVDFVSRSNGEGGGGAELASRASDAPRVSARICEQRHYVEVQVQLRDHPGLLLRSVRALADLGYQIFHASADREMRANGQMEALELVYAQKLDGGVPSEQECRTLERDLEALLSLDIPSSKPPLTTATAASSSSPEDEQEEEKVFWDGDFLAFTFSRRSTAGSGKHFLNLLYFSRTCASDKKAVRETMEQARWELEAKDGNLDPDFSCSSAAAGSSSSTVSSVT